MRLIRLRPVVAAFLLLFPIAVSSDDRPAETQFAVAIESGDVEKIKALLESGEPADTLIDYGEHKITPLMKAAWEGETEIVEILLAAGANVNAKSTDSDETALMSAVKRERADIVKILLKAGAEITPQDKFGFSAFTTAVAGGYIEISEILLEAGADIEAGAHGLTPLMFAVSAGNNDMIRFLAKQGANLNAGAKTGPQTPLIMAIYAGQVEALKTLIELKADVNAKTNEGDTPLKAAQKGDQEDIIALLEAAGAKP